MTQAAYLALGDGSIFEGIAIGALGTTVGELVFNTAMTGYQEILSDPSYARQIVTFTMPHIGNTGVNAEDMESSRIWASGLVLRHPPKMHSNYRAEQSLPDWLVAQNIVGIAGLDTRALTLRLRDEGSLSACITTDVSKCTEAVKLARDFVGLEGADLASLVSCQRIESWSEGDGDWAAQHLPAQWHVLVYDFGVKRSILKKLVDLGCRLTIVPANTAIEQAMALNPDGVVLANGPGDPAACLNAIKAARFLLEKSVPMLGICLGFQIFALACGAATQKMKFGHHGANHPVKLEGDGHQVLISSQNHGFMVDEASMPVDLEVTHRSLFDGSLQGIRHRTKPAIGFQGHPEANPGPHDLEVIFTNFTTLMQKPGSMHLAG